MSLRGAALKRVLPEQKCHLQKVAGTQKDRRRQSFPEAMSTTLGLHRLHTGRRRGGLGSLRRAWKQLPSRRGHRGEGRRLGASSQTGGFSPAAQGPHMPISRGTLWPRAPRALVGSARMGHEGSVAPCSGSSSQILWLREDPELTKHSTDRAGCPASVTSGTAILST